MEELKLSIVIPVYNSQDCLALLNTEMVKALSNFGPYELILVNDNSKDKSWEKIKEICAVNKNAIGISLRKNTGQNCAIMAGLNAAKGSFIVIMDDDLQHQPGDIHTLYGECVKGNYDVCFASYFLKKQKIWKNFGSWLNGKLSEKLLNKPKGLYLSPFKIMKKEVATEILKFKGADPYIDAMILKVTSNIGQLEVKHHERVAGKSNFSFKKSLSIFISHATYSVYPLRVLTITGFSSAFISFLVGLAYLAEYLYSQQRVEGWISVILLLIFFGGLMLMSVGLIGEYIARIFLSVNTSSHYFIAETISGKQLQEQQTQQQKAIH